MEYINVVMCRQHLGDLPGNQFPGGFSLRTFLEGDEDTWARIETAAGEFSTIDRAQARFREEFGGHEADLAERCLFLLNPQGRAIGTAMGWYGQGPEEQPQSRGDEAPAPVFEDSAAKVSNPHAWGRLHWVGIVPEWQARGLSKPLVAAAMRVLARHHDRAYLTTQTTSYVAVKVYLDFGFEPCVVDEGGRRGWHLLAEMLRHPALAEFGVPADTVGPGN